MEIQKTSIASSPLLKPVIERDYTKGLDFSGEQPLQDPAAGGDVNIDQPINQNQAQDAPNFNKPTSGPSSVQDDSTRPFTFDENIDSESDVTDEDSGNPTMTLPPGSAKSFANFVGNALQMYLPKATYGYVKIDLENVIVHVEKGDLTSNWIETFRTLNKNTEEALAIPDESIKMWKSAFKDFLEYKNVTFANPETTFYAATALLLSDQGVRAYQIKKTNEKYMKEALEASNPGLFAKSRNMPSDETSKKETSKTKDDESKAA